MARPELLHRGKVRDTYRGDDDTRVIVASDRISVFDIVLNEEIPGKGRVLTEVTKHWLGKTPIAGVMPNHMVPTSADEMPEWVQEQDLAGSTMVARNLNMLPVEAIVRGYITGSAWKDYGRSGIVSGIGLPIGLKEMQAFPEPIFTPSTKAEVGHDEPIDFEQMVAIIGNRALAKVVKARSLELYQTGAHYAAERGIILVDTKFEFGLDPLTGELVLADEVLTPDSSRYVDISDYDVGRPPKSMDKQIVRDAMAATGWDKTYPAPPMPEGVAEKTQAVYMEIEERLTGVTGD